MMVFEVAIALCPSLSLSEIKRASCHLRLHSHYLLIIDQSLSSIAVYYYHWLRNQCVD
jgi:hypothetical protein